LERWGATIREAETVGVPWDVDEAIPTAKHLAKSDKRFTRIAPFTAAAIRLLLFTGCRYGKSCTCGGSMWTLSAA
jgi:hypothetical protein